jgi:integrase
MSSKSDEKGVILYQPATMIVREEQPVIEATVISQHSHPDTVLQRYKSKLRPETIRRHIHDLNVFCRFLKEKLTIRVEGGKLENDLYCWRMLPLSAPLLEEYCLWLQHDGYAVGSVNVRLDTIQVYCKHLAKAGLLAMETYAAIKLVEGIKKKEARAVDLQRKAAGIATRKPDARKAGWIELTTEQVNTLLKGIGTATPLARRDNLLIRMAWLHALRVGEVVGLTIDQVDQQAGILIFDRPKTSLYDQRLRFSPATLRIIRAYIQDRMAETTLKANIPLFASFKPRKDGEPAEERAIIPQIASRRVATLVRQHVGIAHASYHDGRHKWATDVFSNPAISMKDGMEAGGWKTPYMPMEYTARLKISNEHIRLPALEVDQEEHGDE